MVAPVKGAAAGLLRGWLCLSLVALLAAVARGATDGGSDDEGLGVRLGADVSYGQLSGDYGTGEQSDLDVLSTRVRWALPRGEVRISVPYLRLRGPGNVTVTPGGPIGDGPGNGNGGANGSGNSAVGGSTAGTAPSEITEVEGIGDLRLRGEWYALEGATRRPWISVLADVKAPTAAEDTLGTGEIDVKGGLGLVQPIVARTSLLADASYTWMGDPAGIDYEDVISLGAGLSRKLGSMAGRYAFAYLERRSHPIQGQEARLDLQLGVSARIGAERRNKLAGSLLWGLSDSAEDFGFVMSYGRSF